MDVINARVVPAVSGFIGQMKSGQGAGGQFAAGLDKAANAGKKVATFLDDNREVLVAVGAGFIAAKTAVVAFGVAAKVQAAYAAIMTLGLGGMTAAEAAATGATWSLNTALRANPIGLVVTAVALLVGAFVLAYKKVDWFRNSVNWLWKNALKPLAGFLMGGLRVALKGAGVVFRWLYENGIKPVGRFIRDRLVPWLMTLASGWLRMARFGLRAFRWLLTGAFKTFDGILSAAEKGLGWVPKLGPKIRGARAAFDKFGDGVIGKLKGVEGKARLRAAQDRPARQAAAGADRHRHDLHHPPHQQGRPGRGAEGEGWPGHRWAPLHRGRAPPRTLRAECFRHDPPPRARAGRLLRRPRHEHRTRRRRRHDRPGRAP